MFIVRHPWPMRLSKPLLQRVFAVLLLAVAASGTALVEPVAAQQRPTAGDPDRRGNACNAGNAGIEKALAQGPVALVDVLNALETWYNGEGSLEMRTIVVRIDGGRVRGHELTTGNQLRSGQRVATHELMGSRDLFRRVGEGAGRVGQMVHVDEHVDAGAFLAAVEARADDRIFNMLGRPKLSGSVLVVATVPARARDQAGFTMHPLILMLTR